MFLLTINGHESVLDPFIFLISIHFLPYLFQILLLLNPDYTNFNW